MTERSLRASPEGIQKLRKAIKLNAWKQDELRDELGLKTRQPITRVLAGEPIERATFEELCQLLDLSVAEVATSDSEPTDQTIDIAALVQTVRSQIQSQIHERYGRMRMLAVGWVPVDEIYVSLKVLKPVDHNRLFTEQRDQLQVEPSDDDYQNQIKRFHRIGLSQNSRQAEAALKVLRDRKKAIILGTPGAGKTTLLRSLAVECIKEQPELDDLKHCIPVFLVLKDVVKDFAKELDEKERLVLVKAIQWEMQSWAIEPEVIETLLSSGKLLLLLDGLDEVSEHYGEAIVNQIRQLCQRQQYGNNRILVTCRTQQQQYRFDSSIVDLELDDFNSDQVKQFIKRWFALVSRKDGAVLADQLIHQLEAEENRPVAELAVTPILLNLVCIVALRHQGTLPKRRSDLYTDGIRALLTEWDEFEGKQQRQRRLALSIDEKEDLLSYIALALFEKNDYIPERKTLECLIRSKLNIPRSQAETLLKSFETEHGLLVERDRNYWSFSHLTFQEYFAAREIVESRDPEILPRFVKNITENRWREVFLLTVEMLPEEKANELVRLMKQQIDELLRGEKLQEFLGWVQEKSNSALYKPAVVRAFYFNLALGHARAADSYNRSFDLFALDIALYRILDRANAFAHTDVDLELIFAHAHTSNYVTTPQFLRTDPNFFNCIDLLSRVLEFELPSTFMYELQQLKEQLPVISWENRKSFKQWWNVNGQAWTERLRATMLKHRNVGRDWQFSTKQKQVLWQYHDANKLLVDCLNNDCCVSRDVRAEIEETLLLPMSEIEQRRNTK